MSDGGTKPVVVIANPRVARVADIIADRYDPVLLWEAGDDPRLSQARVAVAAGEFVVPDADLARMPALELIAVFSVGYDGIDVPAMRDRGIAVTHARDANVDDVADHAIGMIVAARRGIVDGDRAVRAGRWDRKTPTLLPSLTGARMGIVGLGAIGEAIARRADAMRMTVAWWGPRAKPDAAWPYVAEIEALARDSDILVVAAKATADNRGLVSAAVIDALGPDGLLVNVARGQLVDEDALIAALRDGRLGAAALDVFADEPTPAERWADVPNTVLTPHTAGATRSAVAEMARQLHANLDAFHAGRPLVSPAA